MLKDHTKKLAQLYTKTGLDWELHVSLTLTEPVCPCASIFPETLDSPSRYFVWADTIEQAIIQAVDRVHREVIMGEDVPFGAPFTNPADQQLAKLVAAWKRGEKPEIEDDAPDVAEAS